jgi:hypothetical protein
VKNYCYKRLGSYVFVKVSAANCPAIERKSEANVSADHLLPVVDGNVSHPHVVNDVIKTKQEHVIHPNPAAYSANSVCAVPSRLILGFLHEANKDATNSRAQLSAIDRHTLESKLNGSGVVQMLEARPLEISQVSSRSQDYRETRAYVYS